MIKHTRKLSEDLLYNRALEFREKREEAIMIDNTINSKDHNHNNAWIMSLRKTHEDHFASTYLKVGADLYTKISQRTGSAEPIIKNPRNRRTSSKTFRDYPYYKSKIEEARKINGVKTPTETDQLQIIGKPKFPMELEAAQAVGYDYVEFMVEPNQQDEVIEEFYDKNFKLRKY